MFDYDLVVGHRWIAGDEALLHGCDHHRDPARIPVHEATRLLLNRTSGLLFAAERLARPTFGPVDADFVGRNLAKACLAFGDVVLVVHHRYHWSCLERRQRLRNLVAPTTEEPPPATSGPPANLPDVSRERLLALHDEGVAFKLHPTKTAESRESLVARHAEIAAVAHKLWVWLESRRLGENFASAGEYARSRVDKCPETSAVRNRLINFRTFGLATPLCAKGARYPRERLLHALPLLLWEYPNASSRSELHARLRWELLARRSDLRGWVAAYERLWHRFN